MLEWPNGMLSLAPLWSGGLPRPGLVHSPAALWVVAVSYCSVDVGASAPHRPQLPDDIACILP